MTRVPAPEILLADTAWLRNLARRLVGDELAADLQQDVAVAALARPQDAAAGRSWLAAVAHNLAVSRRRRASAEQRRLGALPPREPVPSPAELVATAELQQQAVAAVLALPEVYRDTVLLRFLQGLSLQATAAAMGVPEETVRTRQKRALALLRAQLAPAPRQPRGQAALLLTALAAWGTAVKVKHVAVAAAAVMVALLVTVPWLQPDQRPPAGSAPPHAGSATAALAPPPLSDAAAVAAGERTRAPDAAAAMVGTPAAELTVQARWPGGAPAAGIAVQCNRSGSVGTFARTDASGEVCFAGLEPARYNVSSQQYDHHEAELAAGERKTLVLELEAGFTVRGAVLDRNGGPVADAELRLGHAGVAPNWIFPAGRSDRDGRFEVPGCRGVMVLGACSPLHGMSDFQLLTTERHGGAAPEEVVLRLLRETGAVRGRVADAQGLPVEGAWVQFGPPSLGALTPDADGRLWAGPPAALCTTDAEGRFEVAMLGAGVEELLVWRQGFAPHRQPLPIDAHTVRQLEVVLRPGGSLQGTARGDDSEPLAGVEVSWDDSYPMNTSCTTGNDGAFRLVDLPAGELRFTAAAHGLPAQQRAFAFAGGEAQGWDLVLSKGLRIRGRLVDAAGQPLAAWFIDRSGADQRAKTDADGRFVVAGCDPAGNTLGVRDQPGFVPEVLRFLDVLPGEDERTFVVPADRVPSARVRGQCLLPDGTALAEVTLDCEQDGRHVLLRNELLRAAADGTFDLGPFPPGRYRLQPRHQRWAFAPVAVDLQPNDRRELGILRAALPARLVVRLNGDGDAAAGAQVELDAGGHRLAGSGQGHERTFARVFPGRYRLVVRVGGSERSSTEIELAPGADVARELALR